MVSNSRKSFLSQSSSCPGCNDWLRCGHMTLLGPVSECQGLYGALAALIGSGPLTWAHPIQSQCRAFRPTQRKASSPTEARKGTAAILSQWGA